MRPLLAALLCCALAAPAAAEPVFLSVLPAGQDGLVPLGHPVPGPHAFDQLAMYRDLILDAPGLDEADLPRLFKELRVAPPATPERVETPRPGVTIARDAFGVPHVTGTTRADVFFGVGYATAEDRLFVADALRHIGRGRFSEFAASFLGVDATLGFDRTYYAVAGHSEAELAAQIEESVAAVPEFGPLVLADATAYVAGMNARIAEARVDPLKLPAEYVLLGLPLEDWRVLDLAASAVAFGTVIGFGRGGGDEHRNVVLRQALEARFGSAEGLRLWKDLRSREDPEAPLTTTRRYPYPRLRRGDDAAVAIPDPGSIEGLAPLGVAAAVPSLVPRGMSNFLAVTAARAEGGHPILVGGPQTGYFAPQALMEVTLHGGGLDVAGATVPGLPYVILGHTPDYAFTATAGGSDLADVRVERVCDPPGEAPGTGTVYQGTCRPMLRREDTWTAGGQTVTATVLRTVHGPVFARATVGGEPVVLAVERSNFGREIESAPGFVLLNENRVQDPDALRDALGRTNLTLNWLWVGRRDVAYFHAGLYPVRAPGVDPDLPSWGTGEWEWEGFLGPRDQPFARNPRRGFVTSWNNKPARDWHAADGNYSYGSVYRSLALDVRLRAALDEGKVSIARAVDVMADAATVDLRGQTVLPEALALARGAAGLDAVVDLLEAWAASGAHRRDRDGDGHYDDGAAVALMDEWYPRLVHAVFDTQLAGLYGAIPLGFDDAPSNGNLGSAYQSGWYGYLRKVLRQALGRRVQGRYQALACADGTRTGCAAAVRASLADAVAALTARFGSPAPADWDADPTADEIHFSLAGLALVGPIPWQNRPTFQQVVQIR